jgi:hypothetical protein
MKRLFVLMAVGFLAFSASLYFFIPSELSYPEDDVPTPILAR